LWAALGAELCSGIDAVLDIVGFDEQRMRADVIVTGEDRSDAQSAEGKVLSGVLRGAGSVPVYAIAGQVALTHKKSRR
jgi:glycerate kinase